VVNFRNNHESGIFHQLSNVVALDSYENTLKLFVLCILLTCQIQINFVERTNTN